MANEKFRKPNEIKAVEKACPISARIREGLYSELKIMAKDNGYPLSRLVEEVLEDYVAWVRGNRKKGRK